MDIMESGSASGITEHVRGLAMTVSCIVATVERPVRFDNNLRYAVVILGALFPDEEHCSDGNHSCHNPAHMGEALRFGWTKGWLDVKIDPEGTLDIAPKPDSARWVYDGPKTAKGVARELFMVDPPYLSFMKHLAHIFDSGLEAMENQVTRIEIHLPPRAHGTELCALYNRIGERFGLPPATVDTERDEGGQVVITLCSENDEFEKVSSECTLRLSRLLDLDLPEPWSYRFDHEEKTYKAIARGQGYTLTWESTVGKPAGTVTLVCGESCLRQTGVLLDGTDDLGCLLYAIGAARKNDLSGLENGD